MSNPNKAKGTKFESEVRDYLIAQGIPAYRPAQQGWKDTGDINGVSPVTLQCKAYKDLASALRDGVDGANVQRVNAKERWGAAVIKRARRGTKDAYVVMDLATFAEVLAELRGRV